MKCSICRRERSAIYLDEVVKDISYELDLDPETVTTKVRYCNDSDSCKSKLNAFVFFTKETVRRASKGIVPSTRVARRVGV